MRRRTRLTILAMSFGLIVSLLFILQAHAQINGFTFYIPFPADQLDDLFNLANNDNNFIDDAIATTISISLLRNGTIVYYDHWEDGLERNLTSPTQASTRVWGDNNPSNGIPPGFADDVLNAGDIIVLRNTVVLPRNRDELFFDGGDKITAAGGSLAVSLAVWPESASTLFAGAWGLLSTGLWGTEYVIPVGVDLFGGGPGLRAGFGVAAVNVQALEDGTTVQLDLDGDGNFETTLPLDEGEQFTQTSGDARSGARIRASAPVQVHLFTGNPNPGVNFEARAYTMQPFDTLSDEYLVPRSSDGDHWLYNPDTIPLTITAVTSSGVTTLTIPADSTIQFPSGALSGPTGVHFTSSDGRPFDGLTALDQNQVQDWGYAWAPIDLLTSQVLVGWAPGNNRIPPSSWTGDPAGLTASRVYVTALTTTTVNVDYDLDGIVDNPVVVTPLEEADIVDPSDYDMTGALLYTTDGVPFASVWGQDESAPPAEPSIDVGTGLIPLASLAVQKSVTLIVDADGSGSISWGDTVRFQIFAENNSSLILQSTVISDTLPSTVDYLASSSTVRGGAIPDDEPPRTIFPFDEGGYPVGDLAPREAITGTYDAVVLPNVVELCNTANADSPSVPAPPVAEVCVPVDPAPPTPTPTLTPEPPPTSTPKPPSKETPEPPAPTATPLPPPPTATPLPTPTALPVVLLPETGSRGIQADLDIRSVLMLVGASLVVLGLGSRLVRRK
jgi:uncharacterized repeat protein (TIGR01451 family)